MGSGIVGTSDDAILQRAGGEVDPDVQAVQRIVQERGDFDIELEDGTRMRASEALAEADRVIAEAEAEGNGILAAVECFLGVGT